LDQIKDIVEFMRQNGLVELSMEDADGKLSLKRESSAPAAPAPVIAAPAPTAAPAPAAAPAADPGVPVKSPLVGTFYRSSSPDADPFVKVGSHVGPNSVVCIIEAMKVMNEIKAGVSGTVRKVLLENASAVQFGQPMFLVDPD
jgi:acetyl-CoA carboxylase biotin carboxyl carrier protein